MNKFEYKNLTPFKWFVLENFPFIEADFDALTEWQLFCKLGKEMNKIINSENTLGTQMENVTNAFIELQNYVNNYFENLDVQDEINNKLDEMAEDGTLAEIFANYLNLTRFIDTTTNLINETSTTKIKKGYIIETFGYAEINDGGNTKILITDVIPQNKFYFTLQNNLYGIPLTNKENVLIYGIKNDGVTDNTTLLNQLINYTNKLYFPAGTYLLNELNIDNKSNFELYGDGYDSILKCNNPNTKTFFYFIKMSNGENYKCHNLKLDSLYIGLNMTFTFINASNSTLENCFITGSTGQRTVNIQNYDTKYGYNNTIKNNYVLKDSVSCISGALIECTGELSGDKNQFLHNTKIINNTCICKCIEYIGDIDLFDCIETDNCYDTLINDNYCETTMHHGISLDTRNIRTICSNNHVVSKSTISGAKNGIEITGTYGAELMEGIVSNNIIDGFGSNGIAINAKNYSIIGNRINNSNRGIILLELTTEGNMICDNICTNITEFGIYVSGSTAGARILNNNASIYVGKGTGGLLYIESPVSSANNFIEGLTRILYLNGIHKNDNLNGLNNTGFALDLLSDGRLIFRNPASGKWQSITKTDL